MRQEIKTMWRGLENETKAFLLCMGALIAVGVVSLALILSCSVIMALVATSK